MNLLFYNASENEIILRLFVVSIYFQVNTPRVALHAWY